VLPTLAALIGKPLPEERQIDGFDVSGVWRGATDQSPRDEFLYYSSHGEIEGIRQGDWKLLVKRPRGGNTQKTAGEPQVLLFNLSTDLGEKENQSASHPEVVARLQKRMTDCDAEITDNARPPWVQPKSGQAAEEPSS
jgi:arylsulfatase A